MDGNFVVGELIARPRTGGVEEARRVLAREAPRLEANATAGGALLMRADETLAPVAPSNPAAGPDLRYASEELRERAATLLLAKKLQATGMFDYVAPNYVYRPMAVPNDPFYRHQWHYPHIALPRAWDITKGDDDVVVAVIDSGVVTDHPDLHNRLLRDAQGSNRRLRLHQRPRHRRRWRRH